MSFIAAPAQELHEPLALDKSIYKYGETIQLAITDPERTHVSVALVNRHAPPDIPRSNIIFTKLADIDNNRNGPLITHATLEPTNYFLPSRLDRGYFDLVMYKYRGYNKTEVARKPILIIRETQALAKGTVNWSFPAGAKVIPAEELKITLAADSHLLAVDPTTGYTPAAPTLQIVRLGRVMPGGAVESDFIIDSISFDASKTVIHNVVSGVAGVSVLWPRFGVTATAGDFERINKVNIEPIPLSSSAVPDRAWEIAGVDKSAFSRMPGGENEASNLRRTRLLPGDLGYYEARVLNENGTVLAKRQFEVVLPNWHNTIEIISKDESPYDEPPTINITIPDGLDAQKWARLVSIRVSPVGRHGIVYNMSTLPRGPVEYGEVDGRTYTFKPSTPAFWPLGPYSVVLSYQGVLLEEKKFELKFNDVQIQPYSKLQPELTLTDVKVTTIASTTVFGEKIEFTVLGATSDQPLGTGPLIAELYAKGFYTYGCAWQQGYYTGAGALVDSSGNGLLLPPGETGTYEIRIFRPHRYYYDDNGDATENYSTAFSRSFGNASDLSSELIGVAEFKVVAPAAPDMIRGVGDDLYQLHEPVVLTITDPGPAFRDHILGLQLWQGADRVPGGLNRQPMLDDPIISEEQAYSFFGPYRLINQFPFDATISSRHAPGNYEVRVWDATTARYIARKKIFLRDPGLPTMPAFAAHAENLADDWPYETDPLRSIDAWAPPKDECVDPVFEDPPELTIVHYWYNESDNTDGEYLEADNIWPGHPYFVQAEFIVAPSDETYRVKVDGERRVRIYRSKEDPAIYRSGVITFAPDLSAPESTP